MPVIGVNNARPMIEVAGEEHYEALMMPLSLALTQRCDAVLRIGGASNGADREVEAIRALGRQVFTNLSEIPQVGRLSRSSIRRSASDTTALRLIS